MLFFLKPYPVKLKKYVYDDKMVNLGHLVLEKYCNNISGKKVICLLQGTSNYQGHTMHAKKYVLLGENL